MHSIGRETVRLCFCPFRQRTEAVLQLDWAICPNCIPRMVVTLLYDRVWVPMVLFALPAFAPSSGEMLLCLDSRARTIARPEVTPSIPASGWPTGPFASSFRGLVGEMVDSHFKPCSQDMTVPKTDPRVYDVLAQGGLSLAWQIIPKFG